MNDEKKTKKQLIDELIALRKQVPETDGFEKSRLRTLDEAPNVTAFYRHLLENIDEGILVMDKDDKIFFVNDPMAKIAGIPKEQMFGAGVLKDFSEDTLGYFRSYYLEAKESLNTVSFDSIKVLTPKGRMTYQSGILVPMGQDKHFDGMICTIFDNTKCKQMEEVLRESEERYRTIVEISPDPIIIYDLRGKILAANMQTAKIYGVSSVEEFLREIKTVFDLLADEDKAFATANFRHTLAEGISQKNEYLVRLGEGKMITVEINSSIIRAATGEPRAFISVIRDITGQKLAVKALRETEKLFRLITDNVQDTVWLMDMNMQITWISPSVEQKRGFTLEELRSLPPERHLTPESFRRAVAWMEENLIQERLADPCEKITVSAEMEFYRKDGSMFWADTIITLLRDGQGIPTGFLGVSRDITDRKRVEEALRESELRYQTIFETTGTIMLIVEEDMTISLTNDGFENLTGYKREEVEGKKKWTEFVEKGDLERMVVQHKLRRVESGLAKKSYEFRLVHRDGSLRNIFLTIAMIPGTKKSVTSLIDITDRKKAEEALRNSEEKFRALANSSCAAIFLIQGTKYTYINPAFESIIGYTMEDLADMNFWDFIHPDMRELIRVRGLSRLKRESLPSRYEIRFIAKNGEEKWVDYSAMVIELDHKPTIMGSVFDITDRKKMEEALRESRQQLSDIIEFLPDATFVIDKDEKVIAWNRAIEAMTGIQKKDMLGKGNKEYAIPFYGDRRPILVDLALHPDKAMEKKDTAIRRVGDVLFRETNVPSLSNGDTHLSASASVLRDSRGEIMAAIECVRDITERKKLEERLQRSEKMEALGHLAGGVAHDLNNVLGVLVGYSELLAEKMPEESPLRKYALNIQQSGLRGAAIIQDLLTLARRGVIISEVVDLNGIIFDYLRTPEFEKMKSYHPGVKVWTELEKGLFKIKGSPVHLSKTLMNLVSNAAEAISGWGEVTIRTENRYVSRPIRGYDNVQEGDYVVLMVSDSGTGIPNRDLRKIFEPFYTKKVMGRSGTGLGLAVVWGTVKDHRGYIDVQSEEGKGTVITIYFPVTREEPTKAAETVSTSIYMGRGESILVVDDVKEQRELAVNMLERLGYRVEAVSQGEEAIEYLKNKKVDLAVLDMIMEPGIDGFETYRRILGINPEQKAIIVSGFSETGRVKHALELGAGSFVRKPYILETIGLAVRRELDR
jgi:two-component system, cell cycle sensor histidine kinase and response regulator CckA